MKRNVLFLIVGFFLAGAFALGFWIRGSHREPEIQSQAALQFIQDVLKFGVVEVRLSQIFEVNRRNLTVSDIPIPWTGQRSVVAVSGSGLAGYNLGQTRILSSPGKKELHVELPEPTLLSLNLDFHVIHEEDTFLRRLTPTDRNKIQAEIKQEVSRTIMTESVKQRVDQRSAELLKTLSSFLGYPVRRAGAGS